MIPRRVNLPGVSYSSESVFLNLQIQITPQNRNYFVPLVSKRQRIEASVTLLNTRNVRPSESEWSSDTLFSGNATDGKFVGHTAVPCQIVTRNVPCAQLYSAYVFFSGHISSDFSRPPALGSCRIRDWSTLNNHLKREKTMSIYWSFASSRSQDECECRLFCHLVQ